MLAGSPIIVAPVEAPNPSNAKTSSANASVSITLPAIGGMRHVLSWICWSYSADPTGGRCYVQDGADTILDFDVTAGGPGALPVPDIPGSIGSTMTITLTAGGAGVTGKLNIYSRTSPYAPGSSVAA